ncbi:hypothetical protein HUG17_4835 [Dermatophagoides farinae]|uniref:Uncharacterized protein n=1 Tax=Dermatophagoides farinae TaxID=6954 RepID=A0A9D4NZ56_DERFA|nr:uncharacterized protein LOC124492095 [Dermatophagoides farinae]KAH7641790.1 hypothetical protein HUG17_4835 [Dermatophagoides farinae]
MQQFEPSNSIKRRIDQHQKAEMSSATKIANGMSVNGRLKKQDTFQSNSSTTINLTKFDSNYHSSFQCRMYNKSNVRTSKLFRILTVVAYIIAVSMAAILLSIYYTFIWNPHHHRDDNSKAVVTLINQQQKQQQQQQQQQSYSTTMNSIFVNEPLTSRSSQSFIHEQKNKNSLEINSLKSRPITNQTTNVRQ